MFTAAPLTRAARAVGPYSDAALLEVATADQPDPPHPPRVHHLHHVGCCPRPLTSSTLTCHVCFRLPTAARGCRLDSARGPNTGPSHRATAPLPQRSATRATCFRTACAAARSAFPSHRTGHLALQGSSTVAAACPLSRRHVPTPARVPHCAAPHPPASRWFPLAPASLWKIESAGC